ncbi:coiled-coil domain-containing protein 9 [Hemicordylus capensis]|uniref:coiled-coil domain-containing protein 9 n=1 Tax=Hemicordylus capensis TaxID=884348 RepID=UPI00230257DC|nr:coiled-coil domain-containing protein 9 [Hemicordylus capensis]
MSASLDLKSKEEKDAELDKRIEALRRKNQALIKRYQEIEEDRKKAEQEGIAVTGGRRSRPADGDVPEKRRGELDPPTLTVQVLLSPKEMRVVSSERKAPAAASATPKASRSSPSARGPAPGGRPPAAGNPPEQPSWEGAGADGLGASKRGRGGRGWRSRGRGGPMGDAGPDRRSQEWEERRRQNIEKMNEEMEKIAEYERSQRDGLQEKNPVRNFLDDPRRSGSFAEVDRREGSRRHIRNWGGADFEKVKTDVEQGKERSPPGHGGARRRGAALDMTLSMTGRERAEYLRWKQERERIDQERLARHRQPTGEWRREWDAEKMDTRFKEGAQPGHSAGSKPEEGKRPPKLPTFGEFLPEQQPDRRRKGRGRGRVRGAFSKPYSMHDNRWEKEEPDPEPAVVPVEEKAEDAKVQQGTPPASPQAVPEEDEDQWEDVSEGEEEAAAGSGSQGCSQEEEEEEAMPPPRKSSPPSPPKEASQPPPGRDGLPPRALPPPPAESPVTEGKPLTPFSPVEGYRPVSDWGEEMELSSPRADTTSSPLGPRGEELPASAGPATDPALSSAPSAVQVAEDSQQDLPGQA